MSVRLRRPFAFVVGAAAPLLIVCTLLWLLWLRDVRNDRKHTVRVNMPTAVFVGTSGDGGCHGRQLTTIKRGTQLQVQRIRYLKDCAAIDVVLPDGRTGYLVLGIGDVSVDPSLPTI
jgi:hypothetical protein